MPWNHTGPVWFAPWPDCFATVMRRYGLVWLWVLWQMLTRLPTPADAFSEETTKTAVAPSAAMVADPNARDRSLRMGTPIATSCVPLNHARCVVSRMSQGTYQGRWSDPER